MTAETRIGTLRRDRADVAVWTNGLLDGGLELLKFWLQEVGRSGIFRDESHCRSTALPFAGKDVQFAGAATGPL